MNMRDPDFSFEAAAEHRRRRKLEAPRPTAMKRGEPGWKFTAGDQTDRPRWKAETDTKSGVTTFTELVPPGEGGGGLVDRRHSRSIFRLAITSPCLVASQHAEIGSMVICYHRAAGDLISSGNARVIEETRNAF
jgi:hypothetical protein